jgi:hypothetical protein
MQYKIISYDETWHISQVAIFNDNQEEVSRISISLKGLTSISNFENRVHQTYSSSLPPPESDINSDILNHVKLNIGKDALLLATPASTQTTNDNSSIWDIKSNFVSSSQKISIDII